MDALPLGAPVPNWTPPPRPAREPLEGRYARVVPYDAARHAAPLFEGLSADDRLWTYLGFGPFADLAAYRAWVEPVAEGEDPMLFALIDRAADRPGGVAAFMRIAPEAGTIEIGHIMLTPGFQRGRAATEALMLMVAYAFALGYRRVEWKCNALNAASRRAAQRLGFSYEGVFRQAAVMKGRNRDTAWYAIIDAEWPDLRAVWDCWLDPGNFDAEGRQKQRLSALTRPLLAATG